MEDYSSMTDNELVEAVSGLKDKFQKLVGLSEKIAKEMDSLHEQFQPIKEEMDRRGLVSNE